MKSNLKKKTLSMLLAVCLVLTLLPLTAFAVGETITYPGNGVLDNDPIWETPGSLFPNDLSGNIVTVNDDVPGVLICTIPLRAGDCFPRPVPRMLAKARELVEHSAFPHIRVARKRHYSVCIMILSDYKAVINGVPPHRVPLKPHCLHLAVLNLHT